MKFIKYLLVLLIPIVLSSCMIGKPSDIETTHCDQNESTWDNCPITITGYISGSSYSETIKLSVKNTTSKDIDSIKLLIEIDESNQLIYGYYTVDTIWANSKSSVNIPAYNYSFIRANIYPACIYFKDDTRWGNSSADTLDIINQSQCFGVDAFIERSTDTEKTENTVDRFALAELEIDINE